MLFLDILTHLLYFYGKTIMYIYLYVMYIDLYVMYIYLYVMYIYFHKC